MKPVFPMLLLCGLGVTPAFPAEPTLTVDDIPYATQMGDPPAPEGAPGNGRYTPPLPANPELPTLWLIGDSTVRNGTLGDGSNQQQWGWGVPLVAYFDADKINVVNRAFGGTSSRTFHRDFFWNNLRPLIQEGDFVLIQFGANDNGGARGKGALPGIGPESESIEQGGETEIVHTFGWYLRRYIADIRDAGATPILCSLTPREKWSAEGRFQRDDTTHAAWTKAVARETQTPFVDLYELIARRYDTLGYDAVQPLLVPAPEEHLHTGWDGAVINAECVVAGLKALESNPLAPYFSARGDAIEPAISSPVRP